MSDIAVRAQGLGKRYRIEVSGQSYGRLTESLSKALRRGFGKQRRITTDYVWALKDVSFELARGQALGVIGRNGAGKSTLLKILSRITDPTEGRADLDGRVGSLLEVGTGFHPELSGRENIYLNGAVLGMTRKEIDQRFDEIVSFAEVDKFVETPVKRFSSGMYVRLAFSVAAHLQPEILLVDEVLAVGDVAFQKKCLGKMDEVTKEGRTVIFVSHSMAAIESLCTTVGVIDAGRMVEFGDVTQAIHSYLKRFVDMELPLIRDRADRQGDGRLRFVGFQSSMVFGSPGELVFEYSAQSPLRNVNITVGLFTLRGEGVAFLGNETSGTHFDEIPTNGYLVCRFPMVSLLPGTYVLNVHCTINGILADWVTDAARFDVSEGDFFGSGRVPPSGYGFVALPQEWACEPN